MLRSVGTFPTRIFQYHHWCLLLLQCREKKLLEEPSFSRRIDHDTLQWWHMEQPRHVWITPGFSMKLINPQSPPNTRSFPSTSSRIPWASTPFCKGTNTLILLPRISALEQFLKPAMPSRRQELHLPMGLSEQIHRIQHSELCNPLQHFLSEPHSFELLQGVSHEPENRRCVLPHEVLHQNTHRQHLNRWLKISRHVF